MSKNNKVLVFAAFIAAGFLSSCSVEDILDKDKSSSSEEQGAQGISSDGSQLSSPSEQPSSSSEAPPPPPPPSSSSVALSSSSAVLSSSSNVVLIPSSSSYFTITGGSLWGPNTEEFPSLQVRVPDVIACWDENPEIRDDNPCFTTTAGWWVGYNYGGGKAEVRLEGSYVPFQEGVGIASHVDGSSRIDTDGLRVRLTAQSESGGTVYGGAGIVFNFTEPYSKTQDINSYGGYCITYSSDGPILFKLGHNEMNFSLDCSFEVELPASSSPVAIQMAFDEFTLPRWCIISPPSSGPVVDKESALGQAASVKFETPSTNSTVPNVVNFTIHRLGWLNDGCSVQQ